MSAWRELRAIFGSTATLAIVSLALVQPSSAASRSALKGPLVLKDQGSFFVGGADTPTDAMSGDPAGRNGYSNTDVIRTNQMYVQFQVPKGDANRVPIVLLHGCCLSAKTWEDTPDGRMGWAEYLVRNQHAVYLPDQSSRARSGFDATTINQVRLGQKPASDLPVIFTFGKAAAWDLFRFGPQYPTPFSDQQFPIEALGEFGNQVIPDLNATLPAPNPTYANLAKVAQMAGGAVLVGHSESGFFPEQAALVDSSGVRGIVSIEGQCPAPTDAQIKTLSKVPTLIVFGDHLADSKISAPLWTKALSDCKAFVRRLKAAGGTALLAELPKFGFKGNTHMLMQDRNNLDVADWMLDWIRTNVPQRHDKPTVGKNRDADD